MDNRKALAIGETLTFLGKECIIEGEIGRGSNAIVYKGKYPDSMNTLEWHTVLIKELFPFHPRNAIYRAEDGSVTHETDGEALWQEHLRSFEIGNRVHLRMLQHYPTEMGANFDTFPLHNTWYTILGYTGGRSLFEAQRDGSVPLRRLAVRLLLLLESLSCFHDEGYLHLDISPDNILLLGTGNRERVMLIDFNSVHSLNAWEDNPSTFSVKMGYTAPEIRTGNLAAVSRASDLYSVAAVFYQSLTGATLTPFQMTRPAPPDVSCTPALRGQPDTVLSMVRQILARGLAILPRRRYQKTDEMRQDVEELIDRIDGVGITHCALWEAGKKTVARAIQSNTAFSYIQEDELFPSDTVLGDQRTIPTQQFINGLLLPEGQNSFLTAPGGMGKTTAMLRAVYLHTQRYSSGEGAMAYIPLFGFHPDSPTYIIDRLLENLRFKSDTQSYDHARHRLKELLANPIANGNPVLLLLLDGLNEVQGSTESLLREIEEFSSLSGVRILLSSRSGEAPKGFSCAALSAMTEESVARRLAEKHLLLPESDEIRELLRTPLMLSLFLRSSMAEGRQISVHSADELIGVYFDSLVEKALDGLPEDSQTRWQTEASVYYVLPAIANALNRKTRLSEEELLRVVTRCYRLFSHRILRRAFPQWIGHSRDIRGPASSAEEWYGLIVHDILWKRLGLLIRTEQDGYQIPHQILGEYLVEREKANLGRIRKRQHVQIAFFSGSLILIAALCFGIYWQFIRKKPYDDYLSEKLLGYSMAAYADVVDQYEAINKLLTKTENDPDQYEYARSLYENYLDNVALRGMMASEDYMGTDSMNLIAQTLDSGDYVSWSGKPFDMDLYTELLSLARERTEDYDMLTRVLESAVQNRTYNKDKKEYYEDYVKLMKDLLTYDAEITDQQMEQFYRPHERNDYTEVYEWIRQKNKHSDFVDEHDITDDSLKTLEEARKGLLNEIKQSEAYTIVFPVVPAA